MPTPSQQIERFQLAPKPLTSILALGFGLAFANPSEAQEAVIIAADEIVETQQVLDGTGDSLTIEQGGELSLQDTAVEASGDNVTVTNDGLIDSGDREGIFSTGANVIINNTNTLLADEEGIVSNGVGALITNTGQINARKGIESAGADANIINAGTIETSVNDGITSEGDNAFIMNTGDISNEGANGVKASGANAEITNDGVINADNGLVAEGVESVIINSSVIEAAETGIEARGDDTSITNTGTINALADNGIDFSGINSNANNSGSIVTNEDGIRASDDAIGAMIVNTGNVQAGTDGIEVRAADGKISNSGSITAGDNGIEATGANAQVTNSGQVVVTGSGDFAVQLSGAGSELTNTGMLSSTGTGGAAVQGGDGSQTVTLGEGSEIFGVIDLGDGDDTLSIEAGNASAVLALTGVENIDVADGLALFETEDGVVTVDITAPSVLNEATGALNVAAHAQIAGRSFATDDLATQGTAGASAGTWASAFGQTRSVGDDGAALAYEHNFAGIMAGFERDLGANRLGSVGGIAQGDIATDTASNDTETESAFAGAYIQYKMGVFDVTNSLIAGVESHESTRRVVDASEGVETASASFDSQFVSASANAKAQALMLGGVALVPSVTATYTASSFDGYSEEGTTNANLEFDSRNAQMLTGRAQLASTVAFGAVDAIFRGGIDARASFEEEVGANLDTQSVEFDTVDTDRFVGGFIGTKAVFSETDLFNVSGDLEYQFGQDDTQVLSAGLHLSFEF